MTVNVLAYDSISLNCIWMMCFFTDADNKILFSAKKKKMLSVRMIKAICLGLSLLETGADFETDCTKLDVFNMSLLGIRLHLLSEGIFTS